METIKLENKLRDLQNVLRYHTQAGNWEVVEEIEQKIEEVKASLLEMTF